MKHTNNLGRRLTDIKVSILKLMIDNLDAPITVKALKIKHKDLFDELVRLEKLLEEKNKMKDKINIDNLSNPELLLILRDYIKDYQQELNNDDSEIHTVLRLIYILLIRALGCKLVDKIEEKENGRS